MRGSCNNFANIQFIQGTKHRLVGYHRTSRFGRTAQKQDTLVVIAKRPKPKEKELATLVKDLELNPKQCPFSNKTDWTLRRVYEEDHALLEANFRAYLTRAFAPPFNRTVTIASSLKARIEGKSTAVFRTHTIITDVTTRLPI